MTEDKKTIAKQEERIIREEITKLGATLRKATMDYYDPKIKKDKEDIKDRIKKIKNRLKEAVSNYKLIQESREIGKEVNR